MNQWSNKWSILKTTKIYQSVKSPFNAYLAQREARIECNDSIEEVLFNSKKIWALRNNWTLKMNLEGTDTASLPTSYQSQVAQ